MTPTQNPTAYLKAILTAFGPDHAVQFNQETWSQVHSALRAALAETAEPVAGWKLVPVEPTLDMLKAALDADPPVSMPHWTDVFRARWSAMLNTAPQPPAPAVDYKPLTDPHDHPEPHSYKWTQSEMDYINRRVAAAIAAHEAKRGKA